MTNVSASNLEDQQIEHEDQQETDRIDEEMIIHDTQELDEVNDEVLEDDCANDAD